MVNYDDWLRFMVKAAKEKTDGGCRLWIAGRNGNGYGAFNYEGKQWRAHRFAYFAINGPFDFSLDVLHICDNPPCVNPEHLFLGDAQANVDDMVCKGRARFAHYFKGSQIGNSILTEAIIPDIRRRASAQETYRSIGSLYGVSAEVIYHVVKRHTWRHVP